MNYLMECPDEGKRLLAKEQFSPSRERLLASGLRPGMRVADIGCGVGAVTETILEIIGPRGSVVGIDPSAARLAEARATLGRHPNVQLFESGLPSTALASNSFDYVWCQFVLEYLLDPMPGIAELRRLARPGARVVVSEIDALGLNNWPFPEHLQHGSNAMLRALAKVGFDVHCGRKMFQRFRSACFDDIKVFVTPMYVAAGEASKELITDWEIRFHTLAPVAISEFGSQIAYERFVLSYMELLSDPDALKYSVALTTVGTKTS
jgi:SAM-dependent methyltransferase